VKTWVVATYQTSPWCKGSDALKLEKVSALSIQDAVFNCAALRDYNWDHLKNVDWSDFATIQEHLADIDIEIKVVEL
jgi:hypothetical protein